MQFSNRERDLLIKHLEGGQAFISIDKVLENVPFSKLGKRPSGLPYSFYQIFWHMVYAQKDILEYTVSEIHKDRNWPDDYWPKQTGPESLDEWKQLKEDYFKDQKELKDVINNSEIDLSTSVLNSEMHSYFREILLIIEHNSYHTGQLVILGRLLNEYSS
ncbi:DinB family protein [Gramella sp. AN32]|uniref:DinB family protein n=1 Tax=Christiangramia antarctica TaxID=2058158 RepID=A0ABW5XAF8_9FLAO|nr:DinB family protein [Gramella sp. AN32]MCM4154578.1 hypothetical protein [Gramella sp. AN32]